MNEQKLRMQLHRAINTRLSVLENDPYIVQRVLARADSETKIKKKVLMVMVLSFVTIFALSAAIAAVIISRYELKMYAGVEIIDLLPEQWQQYTICHKTKSGYIVGGFQLGDDYIAPMEADDQIIYLDDGFHARWVLKDLRLEGALFDQIQETENAFYFGLEQKKQGWCPSIMKVSKEGEIIWLFEGTEDIRLKDYIATEDDEVICAGSIISMDDKTASPQAIILKIDQNGRLVCENILDRQNVLYAICNYQEEIVVAGVSNDGATVSLINEECGVEQHKTYNVDGMVNALHLEQTTNGRLVLVINYSPTNNATHVSETSRVEYILMDID